MPEVAETLSSLTGYIACVGRPSLEVRREVILCVIITEVVGSRAGGACGRGPTSLELGALLLFFCKLRGRSCAADSSSWSWAPGHSDREISSRLSRNEYKSDRKLRGRTICVPQGESGSDLVRKRKVNRDACQPVTSVTHDTCRRTSRFVHLSSAHLDLMQQTLPCPLRLQRKCDTLSNRPRGLPSPRFSACFLTTWFHVLWHLAVSDVVSGTHRSKDDCYDL
jgi:hypothetical protein